MDRGDQGDRAARMLTLHTASMPAALVLATAGVVVASGPMLSAGGALLVLSGWATIQARRSRFWSQAADCDPAAEAKRARDMGVGFVLFGTLLFFGGLSM